MIKDCSEFPNGVCGRFDPDNPSNINTPLGFFIKIMPPPPLMSHPMFVLLPPPPLFVSSDFSILVLLWHTHLI